jgi:hypothetical protein
MPNPSIAPIMALLVASAVGIATLFVVPALAAPAVSVRIVSASEQGGNLLITLQVTSHRASALPVTLAGAPGRLVSPNARPIYIVADPSFPSYFGSYADILGQTERVADQFAVFGSTAPLNFVTFAQLPAVLASHPNAVLVDIETGVLPSSILPPNSTAFVDWLSGGGTLVWAGGPLGFFQTGMENGAPVILHVGWGAQSAILGYDLVDPTGNSTAETPVAEPGLLEGTQASPYAVALSDVYQGVPYGANLTEVVVHGGTDLGWNAFGPHPRTSLALLPVGYGSIYFFGGGLGAYGGPSVADAGYALAIDLGRLLGDGFVPAYGSTPTYALVTVPAFGSVSELLTRPVHAGPSALVVQSSVAGVTTFFWSAPTPSSVTVSSTAFAPLEELRLARTEARALGP